MVIIKAAGFLNKAIDSYLKGFENDWRDAYPGINAVTLMEMRNPPDKRRIKQILPIVRYAVERRMAAKKPDYWDYATLIELAVLDKNDKSTIFTENIANALAFSPDKWQVESSLRTINMVKEARKKRNEPTTQIEERVIEQLEGYIKD